LKIKKKQPLQKYQIFILILVLTSIFFGFTLNTKPDPQKDKILIGVIRYILKNGHYEPKNMDDSFSKEVYKNFIDEMDPLKRYFTQKDLNDFSLFKTEIDDQLKREDLSFYNSITNRFQLRLKESSNYYKEILNKPFNYKTEETLNTDYGELKFVKTKNELVDYWRKQLKMNTLERLQYLLEEEKNKFENDSSYIKISFDKLEITARSKTKKTLDDFYERIYELEHSDWFAAFVNSITRTFDPHTNYFAPQIKEQFDISISGKIEGIGARLQEKNDYTKVVELISGGPAWKQGELEVGDIILKVAQSGQESKDIVGMRLDKAIKLIKGKKGTIVTLTVKKIDNSIHEISIIRDIVELEETFIKSSIVLKDGKKYGIINLPKFYIDFNNLDSRDATSDMKREIEALKKENIEGLLIDLRNNGGGSLKTAVEIGGLFINKGPIVQVKYRDKNPFVKKDTDPKIQWDGPLVILTNELSASASEILAAAMQDYQRAVIIGSNQTYGKGTVQNVIPLNKYYNYPEDLGAIKLTIQKFYRINGGSTQLKGVKPDIITPSKYNYVEIGERDQENPLKWNKIDQAAYTKINYYLNYNEVISKSSKRISKNPEFILIDEYAKWLKKEKENKLFSLNFKTFLIEQKNHEKQIKKYKDIFKHESKLKFNSPLHELTLIQKDTILGSKRKAWHKSLKQDIYIDESLHVLSDLKIKRDSYIVKNN